MTLSNDEWIQKITELKQEKNAVILAHYYQVPEIQDVADHIGDSLELSCKAAETNAELIVFSGVHFMAETAKILNPSRKVVLPDIDAGCSLADSCPASEFKSFVKMHPDHLVVTYINCSAEIKAISDIVCTSSNALKIIEKIPEDQPVIFAPDKNLGKYIMKKTGRELLLWDGTCVVHEAFSIDKLLQLHKQNPEAEIIAHPESSESVLSTASFIGSTAGMIKYVKQSNTRSFIVGTEAGILYKMNQEVPDKNLIAAPSWEDNVCACSECEYMKVNTLEKLFNCMKYEKPEIKISKSIAKKAVMPIRRMFEMTNRQVQFNLAGA